MATDPFSKDKISFKPITKGLGFHPFSDGLPYASVSKNPGLKPKAEPAQMDEVEAPRPKPGLSTSPAMGLGAQIAGTPTFVFPKSESRPSKTQQIKKPIAIAEPEFAASPIPVESKWGFLFRRTFAFVLDSGINLAICAVLFGLGIWELNVDLTQVLVGSSALYTILFAFLLNWALITAQEVAFQTSLGKRLFSIKLVGTPLQILGRSALFLVGVAFCGFGLIWALIDQKKRCWHDSVSKLSPKEIASY